MLSLSNPTVEWEFHPDQEYINGFSFKVVDKFPDNLYLEISISQL